MPSLLGTDVAANYVKTSPSTNFGTRQLTVIKVVLDAVFVDYALANSLFSQAVRGLQLAAEVYAVNTPVDAGTDYFTAIIATDTNWSGAASDSTKLGVPTNDAGFGKLEAAVNAATGGSSTITVATIS